MKFFWFLLGFIVFFDFTVVAQDNPPATVIYPEGYSADIDRVYTRVGAWEGRMDVYYNRRVSTPMPVVIHMHGGGWSRGSKESQTGFGLWFKMGFAVVNIAYRLTDTATAPAAIEDVRAALYFVKTNAEKYNINPDKVVMSGGSAGAHLALMAGLLGNNNIFDNPKNTAIDMRVAGILSNYAPVDFTESKSEMGRFRSLLNWLGAKADDPSFRAAVSPVTYINAESPPVFIVHGDADPVVPYQQSVILQKKLDHYQVPNYFYTVKGGLHGRFEKEDRDKIAIQFREFLIEQQIISNN